MFVPAAPGCLRWRQMESNSVENVTDHVLKVDGHEASAESKLGGDRSARGGLSRGGDVTQFCVGRRSPVKGGLANIPV